MFRGKRSAAHRASPEPVELPLLLVLTVSGVLGGVDRYIAQNATITRGKYRTWVVVGFKRSIAFYEGTDVARILYLPMTRALSIVRFGALLRSLPRRGKVIIHSNDLVTCLWGKLISMCIGARSAHLTTIHSVLTEHRVFSPFVRLCVIGISRVLSSHFQRAFVCVSKGVLKSLVALGITNRRMPVLYHAIDLARCRRGVKETQSEGSLRIGFVGRLSREKGPDRFLECVEGLIGRFRIEVFGDGAMRRIFEKYSAGVTMHGFVEDKREIYPKLDIVCITSRTESFSFVLLEALAMGCIPLILPLPVFEELLEDSPIKEEILCSSIAEMRRRIINLSVRYRPLDAKHVDAFLDRFSSSRYRESLLRLYSHRSA